MAQFDVHRNARSSDLFPLLLDVQSDLHSQLRTRIMVPLLPQKRAGKLRTRLNPVVTIAGETYVLQTELFAAVRTAQLGDCVGSLVSQRDEIVGAIDFLLQGT